MFIKLRIFEAKAINMRYEIMFVETTVRKILLAFA